MKKILMIIAIMFTSNLFAQHNVITKSFQVDKNGYLEVEVNPGDIHISTWNKNEVLIKVDGLDSDQEKDLSLYKRDNKVIVKYESEWGWGASSDYSITIPKEMNLKLYTTAGDVSVDNDINGDVRINTMGGDISVQNISGDAQLETMGGDISFKNVSGNASISTQGGEISGMDINGSASEIKTMGGDIRLGSINNVKQIVTYGGDIDVKSSQGDVELTTFGGNITLGEGQRNVAAKTYGGDINIGMANGFVDANTGAGNITLRKISGSVIAKTSAGDIDIELTPRGNEESEIKTSAGRITLSLSQEARVTIEAKAVSSGWNKNADQVIQSDFSGDISNRRGDVIGEFILNGGGNKIYLKTVSGNIYLKKKN